MIRLPPQPRSPSLVDLRRYIANPTLDRLAWNSLTCKNSRPIEWFCSDRTLTLMGLHSFFFITTIIFSERAALFHYLYDVPCCAMTHRVGWLGHIDVSNACPFFIQHQVRRRRNLINGVFFSRSRGRWRKCLWHTLCIMNKVEKIRREGPEEFNCFDDVFNQTDRIVDQTMRSDIGDAMMIK